MAYMKKNSSRSSLFLIELIVTILFFCLASGICIQLFVQAYLTSNHSSELSHALNKAQTVAECFKTSDGTIKSIDSLLSSDTKIDSKKLEIYYDKDWNSVQNQPKYKLELTLSGSNPVTAKIVIVESNDSEKEIYTLETKKYIAKS